MPKIDARYRSMTSTKLYTLHLDTEELELLAKGLDLLIDEATEAFPEGGELVLFRSQVNRRLREATEDYIKEQRALPAAPDYTDTDIEMTVVEFSNAGS